MARKINKTHEGYSKPLAKRLRDLLKEHGVTHKVLADYTGLSRQSVSYYVSGRVNPDSDVIIELTKFFNVSADYLLGLSNLRNSNLDVELWKFDTTKCVADLSNNLAIIHQEIDFIARKVNEL